MTEREFWEDAYEPLRKGLAGFSLSKGEGMFTVKRESERDDALAARVTVTLAESDSGLKPAVHYMARASRENGFRPRTAALLPEGTAWSVRQAVTFALALAFGTGQGGLDESADDDRG